jgi:hypothetical protein
LPEGSPSLAQKSASGEARQYLLNMRQSREWLQAHGFEVISETIGPRGIELTVRSPDGRMAQLVYEPGRDPLALVQSLEAILYGEFDSETGRLKEF